MRTTIDIDEDIVQVTRSIADQRGVSMGKAISDLIRQALARTEQPTFRNDVPLFPVQPGAGVVTLDIVNKLRDEHP